MAQTHHMPKLPINRLPRVRPAPAAAARPVPDVALQQLADRALIPADQREFFFDAIRMNVQTAWELDGLVKGGLANKNGAALLRAALALYEVLGSLNKHERAFTENILGGKSKFIFDRISGGGVGGLRKTAYQLAELFSLVTGKPLPRFPHQPPRPRQRGKKLGGVKNLIFDNFIFDLLISTTTADGKLTLEKNGLFGTLIDAIETLAPHLPNGLVPKTLRGSTIQRTKTRYEQVKSALLDLEASS
jgi:hypothetical protein